MNEAFAGIGQFIERVYNQQRLHSAHDWGSLHDEVNMIWLTLSSANFGHTAFGFLAGLLMTWQS
jgi:hypothetical protein